MTRGVAVAVTGVRRAYGSKVVLAGLDFAAAPGEFVAVIGRSGCGKSTLLRLLAGLDRPDAGVVRLGGEEPRGPWPAARVMFQDGRLLPWLRVAENVRLGLPAGRKAAADALLAAVGLAERAGDWPAVLSGGQRQRVAVARALAADPKLLLLDEPFGSLDALTRLEMHQLVERLWRETRFTAVLVTHDVDEAVALADRVVLLKTGREAEAWAVPLPRPRVRSDPHYTALVQRILESVISPSQKATTPGPDRAGGRS